MSNASRCRETAASYARLAETAESLAARRAYKALERLWLEIAPLAEHFDRSTDAESKERIYELMEAVAEQQRKVA